MSSFSEKILEFDRIKYFLKSYAFSDIGREKIDGVKILDFHSASSLLDELDLFIKETSSRPFPDETIPDIRPILEEVSKDNSILESLDFVKLIVFGEAMERIRLFFKEAAYPEIKEKEDKIPDLKDTISRLKRVFDFEGKMKDDASPELFQIRNSVRNIREKIEKKLKSILSHPDHRNMLQEDFISYKDDHWVIPLKREYKGKIKGSVISVSNTGETLFIEPSAVLEDNSQFTMLKGEEKIEMIRILKRLSSGIRLHLRQWQESVSQLADIELLYSKARYALETKSIKPVLNQEKIMDIINARHPLLKNPVPISISLGESFTVLVITGPNTGGKTVALKTAGLFSLMASSGFFIPAEQNSKISWVDQVLIDLGDEQSISKNLSTFSAHVENLKEILNTMTENSLILIDELGSGTEPNDGSALASAFIERIQEKKVSAIVTSHYERVKNIAFELEGVKNASVLFDLETLSPLYTISLGVTGKSYGLEIAEKLGLDKKIVDRAKQLILSEKKEYDTQTMIARMNDEIIQASNEKLSYLEKNRALEKQQQALLKKEKEIKLIEESLKKKEGGKIIEEINTVRKKLIQLIEEAKNFKDLEILKTKARELEELSKDAKDSLKKEELVLKDSPVVYQKMEWNEIEKGDWVLLKKFNKEASVLEINAEKRILTVLLGNIKMKVSFDEAVFLEKKQTEKKSDLIQYSSAGQIKTPFELNIIGMRREEAFREVENYIYGLNMKRTEEGIIIHGKGTGILKEMVLDFLRSSQLIEDHKVSADGGATKFKLKIR